MICINTTNVKQIVINIRTSFFFKAAHASLVLGLALAITIKIFFKIVNNIRFVIWIQTFRLSTVQSLQCILKYPTDYSPFQIIQQPNCP